MKSNQAKVLNILGRLLYALPMIIFGVFHFLNSASMASTVPGYLPGGVFWVYLTGVALILAGASILMQKFDQLATSLLGIMLLIFVLTVHLPAVLASSENMALALMGLLQTAALAGAAFFMSGTVLANKQ